MVAMYVFRLKNDKDLLPLSKSTKLAVLGPHFNATQDMLSIYRGTNTLVNSHSPLDALSKMGTVVASAQGCALASNDTSGFAAAVEAAKKAQVAVVFVGLHPGQGGRCCVLFVHTASHTHCRPCYQEAPRVRTKAGTDST